MYLSQRCRDFKSNTEFLNYTILKWNLNCIEFLDFHYCLCVSGYTFMGLHIPGSHFYVFTVSVFTVVQ